MSHTNPGLASQLAEAVEGIRAREAGQGCRDQPATTLALKAVTSYVLLAVVAALERPDGMNGLEYDAEQRTSSEESLKQQAVVVGDQLLALLWGEPVRGWDEVATLAEALAALRAEEDSDWAAEVIGLGGRRGLAIARASSGATVTFETADGAIAADVLKAREPDEALVGADVYLVEELAPEAERIGCSPAQGEGPVRRYAVMVDDAYWGRRVQPSEFAEAPFDETLVMGYELSIEIHNNGTPVADAIVSLEIEWDTDQDGSSKGWLQPDEFNGLQWSSELETYVESGVRYGRVITDGSGIARLYTPGAGLSRLILPKGHGAPYQRLDDRRDDSEETGRETLARGVTRVTAVCEGRRAEAREGETAAIDLGGGTLVVRGDPDDSVQVLYCGEGAVIGGGTYDLDWLTGELTLSGLRPGEWHVYHFRRTGGGDVDTSCGGPRRIAMLHASETTVLELDSLTDYSGAEWDELFGRVHGWGAVPLAGVTVYELRQQLDPPGTRWVANTTTDGDGYFEATADPGDSDPLDGWAIDDPTWGYLLFPTGAYHDVVLGGRIVSVLRASPPELGLAPWRKGTYRHENFAAWEAEIRFRERDGRVEGVFGVVEIAGGAGFASVPLPKTPYTGLTGDDGSLAKLVWEAIRPDDSVLATFEIGDDTNVSEAGLAFYSKRSVGVAFPATLTGGKIAGNVVCRDAARIEANLPEAARVGLEFGRHEPFMEVRARREGSTYTCFADMVCPYCGGPVWTDPDRGESPQYVRGYCTQCATAFGNTTAMDGRTYFQTVTIAESK